ncbi:hypothetical protein CERSUDRAFT_96946 [Gelatoporia subvermispora B]|uniref:Uncharacterized protein n=1 Tax=Ceriporiopsis subvermispora (strain B) TaxID=914234 RepID=M2R8K4_CERS8|nr:hypothetical protein CERSUDRAFT_96946 [Gelatoporia subvermispora B]
MFATPNNVAAIHPGYNPYRRAVRHAVDVRGVLPDAQLMRTAAHDVRVDLRGGLTNPAAFTCAQENPTYISLERAMLGKEKPDAPTYMTFRRRIDFLIMILDFGILVGTVNTSSRCSNQDLIDWALYGYSPVTTGLMGLDTPRRLAAAAITAPRFDRVVTYYLARTCKVFTRCR